MRSVVDQKRDFIDFLSLLYKERNRFYIILMLFLSAGIYFDISKNSTYKFSINISVALKDVFYQSDNFQRQMFAILYNEKNSDKADVNIFSDLMWSKNQANNLLSSLARNDDFFVKLANKFQKQSATEEFSKNIKNEFSSSIKYENINKFERTFKFSMEKNERGIFLYDNFVNTLNEYAAHRLYYFMKHIKKSTEDAYVQQSIFSNDKKKMINTNEIQNYIKSYKIPNILENKFFETKVSNYTKSNKINSVVLYFILLFFSLFIHITLSIFFDLGRQINNRNSLQ
jgi:hypothetical protein